MLCQARCQPRTMSWPKPGEDPDLVKAMEAVESENLAHRHTGLQPSSSRCNVLRSLRIVLGEPQTQSTKLNNG